MAIPITIVDDSRMSRKLMIRAFPGGRDVEISQAQNGEEVIKAYHEDINNYEQLINQADTALYQAKEKGRNCVAFYTKDE